MRVEQPATIGSIATARSITRPRASSSQIRVYLSLSDSSFQSKALEQRKETTLASKLLTRNMGRFDRAVHAFVIAPIAIGIAVGLGATSIGGIVLLALTGIALATSATGVCPAYIPLGSTPAAARRCRTGPELRRRDHTKKGRKRWQPWSRSRALNRTELVAVGASVGAGYHPCVDHHLKATQRPASKVTTSRSIALTTLRPRETIAPQRPKRLGGPPWLRRAREA